MGILRRSHSALCTSLLASALAAQQRAPFSGRVLDQQGEPIANAAVTCVFEPDFTALGASDRASTTTDASGHFALDLVPGRAYVVWALGPADAQGDRATVHPSDEAAGGKQLDLIADERRGPMRVGIRGTNPWLVDGPLGLRLLLTEGVAAGPDLPIPGDGEIRLPPWPGEFAAIALLDGRQQPLQLLHLDRTLSEPRVLQFAAPCAVAVLAVDANGQPVARAEILSAPPAANFTPRVQRIDQPYYPLRPEWRTAARTDAAGRAVVRLPAMAAGSTKLLVRRGDLARLVLWDGVPRPDPAQPLLLTLQGGGAARLRVLGLGALHADVAFWDGLTLSHAKQQDDQVAVFASTAPTPLRAGLMAIVQVRGEASLPVPVVAAQLSRDGQFADCDLARLSRVRIDVVDAGGRPAACAQLGVTVPGSSWKVYWHHRLVTDAAGRAELLVDRSRDWCLCAVAGDACCIRLLQQGGQLAAMRMVLEPLACMTLSLVDAGDRPVRGARAVWDGGGGRLAAADLLARSRGGIAATLDIGWIGRPRSDAHGSLRIRFLEGGLQTLFRVRLGELTSEPLRLQAGEQPRRVVLQRVANEEAK